MALWTDTLPSGSRRRLPKLPGFHRCLQCLIAVLQEDALNFYKFVEKEFPAEAGVPGSQKHTVHQSLYEWLWLAIRTYSTESAFQNSVGAHLMRPWQLPHRNDFGLRGTADCVRWLLFSNLICFTSSHHVHLVMLFSNAGSLLKPK